MDIFIRLIMSALLLMAVQNISNEIRDANGSNYYWIQYIVGHVLSERKVIPCGICEQNVGVNSRECKECKKWIHFRCHVLNNGVGWKNEFDYRYPKCVTGASAIIKKTVSSGSGRRKGSHQSYRRENSLL